MAESYNIPYAVPDAGTSSFVHLSKPPQFEPDESVTFHIEFSQNLLGCSGRLVISGSTTINGVVYPDVQHRTTNVLLNASELGIGVCDVTFPPNVFGVKPGHGDQVSGSGALSAIVMVDHDIENPPAEAGGEPETETETVCSNTVGLDMLIKFPDDFRIVIPFGQDHLEADASTKELILRCVVRDTASGTQDTNAINSYCIKLYDLYGNLVWNSDENMDWEKSSQTYHTYMLRDLPDNFSGYVSMRAALAGGYSMETDPVRLNVTYAALPTLSDDVKLNSKNGQVVISLPDWSEVTISRTVLHANEYMELIHYYNGGGNITLYDNYAVSGKTYLYKVEGNGGTYYQIITHEDRGITISDIESVYHAITFDTGYPVTRNDRPGIYSPIGSVKPYAIINGLQNNDHGAVSGLFSYVDECNPKFEDNADCSINMRKWLNNGRAKVLKYNTGEAWIVTTTANATNLREDGLYNTSFNWEEIADVNDVEAYSRLGLV